MGSGSQGKLSSPNTPSSEVAQVAAGTNLTPKSEEKDPKKEELQSSLSYYPTQYGGYDPHLPQNMINTFPLMNRDDKKEAVKDEAKNDIKSSQSEPKAEQPSPRVGTIRPDPTRPKPHTTESNKPTATIQPEPKK